jgi:hypothetical protein
MRTVLVDSDQGKKAFEGCVPDCTIADLREILSILSRQSPKPSSRQQTLRGRVKRSKMT